MVKKSLIPSRSDFEIQLAERSMAGAALGLDRIRLKAGAPLPRGRRSKVLQDEGKETDERWPSHLGADAIGRLGEEEGGVPSSLAQDAGAAVDAGPWVADSGLLHLEIAPLDAMAVGASEFEWQAAPASAAWTQAGLQAPWIELLAQGPPTTAIEIDSPAWTPAGGGALFLPLTPLGAFGSFVGAIVLIEALQKDGISSVNHRPSGSVTVTGTALRGHTLTATHNLADADGLGAITYQWQSSIDGSTWTDIAGATHSTLVLAQAQVGRQVRAVASYVDGRGAAESVPSSATPAIAAPIPAAPGLSLLTDSGLSNSDLITNSGVINVTGLEAGASWQYSTDAGSTWTAGSGSSFALTSDGAKAVRARQIDSVGNVGAASADLSFTLDTLAPSLSTTTTPSTALSTTAGTAGDSAGETITLTITFDGPVNGLTSGSNSTVFTVGGTGVAATWAGTAGSSTRTLTYMVQAGQNGQAAIDEAALKAALIAGISDAAGNAFAYTLNGGNLPNIDSTALPVIDTLAPLVQVTEQLDPDSAAFASGFRVVAGDTVSVSVDSVMLNAAALANRFDKSTAAGQDTYIARSAAFTGAETVVVTASRSDGAGNQGHSGSVTLRTIDTTAPAVAIDTLTAGLTGVPAEQDDVLNAGERAAIDTAGHWLLSGVSTAEPGQVVSVTINNETHAGTMGAGSWTVSVPEVDALALQHGNDYAVVLGLADQAGNLSTASKTLQVRLAPPDIPTVTALRTNTLTPALSGRAEKEFPPNQTPTQYAALELGDSLSVTLGGQTYTLTVGNSAPNPLSYNAASRTWALAVPAAVLTADGTYQVTVRVNAVGYTERVDINTDELTIDRNPPQVTAFGSSSVDGLYGSGASINVQASLSKAVQAGSTLRVTLDSGATVDLVAQVLGTVLSGQYVVQAGQSSGDLKVNGFSIVGSVTDAFGNAMNSTALPATNIDGSKALVVDGLAPTLGLTAPSTALSTTAGTAGNSAGETITLTITFDGLVNGLTSGGNSTVFTVGATAVSATWAGSNNSNTRTLTYTVQAGDNGQALISEAELKSALMAGITDAAGNSFTYTLNSGDIPNIDSTALPVIDTAAPAAPILSLQIDSGSSNSDLITNSGVITLTGLEAGAAWQYSTDGGGSWTAGVGSSFTLAGDGLKSARVRQIDVAGNTGAASVDLSFTLDTAVPVLTVAQNNNTIAGDGVIIAAERAAGILFSGTTESGRSVAIATGLGTHVTVTADGSGNWSTTVPSANLPAGGVVTFTFTSSDAAGNTATVTRTANINSHPTGSVTVSGTATQGQTLTAANTLADADGLGTIGYQWQSSSNGTTWADISGATNSTFVLTQAQVGLQVRAVASYTDALGTAESVPSTGTAAVANVNDSPTGSVAVSGTATQGQTLTAANTLADADGLGTIGYQWQSSSDGTTWNNITGATNSTFVLTQAQVGLQVRALANYTDALGTAESVPSTGTAAVANLNDTPTGSVTVSGTSTQGQALTAANTLADADGLGTIGYQWQSSSNGSTWNNIAGATNSTFVLTQAQVGLQVRAVASYTDAQGTAESVPSTGTAAVANLNDSPTGSVQLSLSTLFTGGQRIQVESGPYDDGSWNWGEGGSDGQIRALEDGGYLLAWAAETSDGQGYDIFVRRYGADNQQQGQTLRVQAQSGAINDEFVSLTTLSNGQAVLTWTSGSGAARDVHVQRIGSNLEALGSPTTLQGQVGTEDIFPQVQALSGGGYVVSWSAQTTNGQGSDAFVQSFDSNGNAVGPLHRLGAESGNYNDERPTLLALADGGFIVIWAAETVSSGRDIFVQRYNSQSQAQGALLRLEGEAGTLNNGKADAVNWYVPYVKAAALNDGGYVLTWVGETTDAGAAVFVQRFTATHQAMGAVRRLEDVSGDLDTAYSEVAALSDGGYVVVWQTQTSTGSSIWVQRFNAANELVGTGHQLQGGDASAPVNNAPQVLALPNAEYAVVWTAWGNGGDSFFYAQRFGADDQTLGLKQSWKSAVGFYELGAYSSTALKDGGWSAFWEALTNDGQSYDMFAQRFTAQGLPWQGVQQGQTLSATHTLADADGLGAITYQWQSSSNGITWNNITGATNSTYVLTQAQVGLQVRAVASYTDALGTAESVPSMGTAAVANLNDAPTGSVTVSGTATQGQTLTAANTLADEDGLGAIGYQWQSSSNGTTWADISGATNSTYVLTQAQVGLQVRAVANYTDALGTAESVPSTGTAAVANLNDAPTGSVTVSGTATQGQTLTAANTLADADGLGAIGYQWQSSSNGTTWADISGATNSTFVLTQAEVGLQVRAVASYTDALGTAESVPSTGTAAVANLNDAPTGSVTVSGTATQGQTLTAANTLADADGLGTIGYQWQSSSNGTTWADIAGATNSTFVLTQAQVGLQVRAVASYTDALGTAESVPSTGTVAVANVNDSPTGSVTVSGTATQGQTLTAANTLADADGLGTIGYQWQSSSNGTTWADIAGATNSTFVLRRAEVGLQVRAVASYTDAQGTAEASTSGATSAVIGLDNTPVTLSAIAAGTGGFVINGQNAGDASGTSVSSAGDVNGDGLADLIVGAPTGGSNPGRSYVVFGTASTSPIDLSAVAAGTGGFLIRGQGAIDQSGISVSSAGDVNGDGLADLIVGANRSGTGGRSYVVFGKADTAVIDLSDVAAGAGGFVINGQVVDDSSGWSTSSAGDVNGDGLADLIVGAFGNDAAGSNAGTSYVVFGKTGTTAIDLSAVAAGTGGFVILGQSAGDFSGTSVSNAGDVNGDGLSDLIVGAPYSVPTAGVNAGRSYVVFGQAGTTAINLSAVAAGTGGFVIQGQSTGDQSGHSVSGAGDVNGDGLADLIVGAPHGGANPGRSYVVFGQAGTTAIDLSAVAAGTGGFVINGQSATSDRSGKSVSGAGDFNGDGLADLIVGADLADPAAGVNAGRSYLVLGQTGTTAIELSAVAAGIGGFVIDGQATSDGSGYSVSGAGDVNGDGLADLIVGAWGATLPALPMAAAAT